MYLFLFSKYIDKVREHLHFVKHKYEKEHMPQHLLGKMDFRSTSTYRSMPFSTENSPK